MSRPGDRVAAAVRRLADAVLNGRGDLAPAARHAIAGRAGGRTDAGAVPDALTSYVDTIARHAYRVTPEQVDGLRAAGLSEDAVFEATVAAALGAGLLRLERGLAAVRGEGWAMHLRNVESGHRLHYRLLMSAMRLGVGEVTDVVRTLLYRGEFFGRQYAALTQAVMRGPSEWSVGTRELFATFVSRQNQCSFWTGAHGAVASRVLGQEVVRAVLEDWRSAPVDERTRATLGFLEKLNRAPAEVGPSDVTPLRAAGVSDEAVADAVHVCAIFNVIDRVADALGFAVPTAEEFARAARVLLVVGYRTMWERSRWDDEADTVWSGGAPAWGAPVQPPTAWGRVRLAAAVTDTTTVTIAPSYRL